LAWAAESIARDGTIRLAFSTGRTSPVDVRDVAEVVAIALASPAGHLGKVYELTGPKSQETWPAGVRRRTPTDGGKAPRRLALQPPHARRRGDHRETGDQRPRFRGPERGLVRPESIKRQVTPQQER